LFRLDRRGDADLFAPNSVAVEDDALATEPRFQKFFHGCKTLAFLTQIAF
jgi:hypothetical protein